MAGLHRVRRLISSLPTDAQKATISQTAQAILDARAAHPDCSLADLYDEVAMPADLRRAHQLNDKAVMAAYGFGKGSAEYTSEAACVASLMRMYQEMTTKTFMKERDDDEYGHFTELR